MQVPNTGEGFDKYQMLFCSINTNKMEDGEEEEIKSREVDAMPRIVTYHPHPPTYIISGTCGRHHDMMMIMVGSEVMAMPSGYRASSS